ncbi:hypothetical protein P3T31_002314 [Rhizobium sp. AN70]|nr:hypothetical protein [Rhizobium sp. AN70]
MRSVLVIPVVQSLQFSDQVGNPESHFVTFSTQVTQENRFGWAGVVQWRFLGVPRLQRESNVAVCFGDVSSDICNPVRKSSVQQITGFLISGSLESSVQERTGVANVIKPLFELHLLGWDTPGENWNGTIQFGVKSEIHALKAETISSQLKLPRLFVQGFASVIGNPHLQHSERSRDHCEDTAYQALEIVEPVSPWIDGFKAKGFATRVHNVPPERRTWDRDCKRLEKKRNENRAAKKQNYSIGPFRPSEKKCPSVNFVSHSTRSSLNLKRGNKRWQFACESKRWERLSPHSGALRVAELRAIS